MKVYQFGRSNHLVGIMHPSPGARRAVIFWNTGIAGRIGPFRGNFEAAEALVKLGYTVFRFDLSKLGDSLDPQESGHFQERTNRDLTDALDLVQKESGISEFALVGLCSSAVDAYFFAIQEKRARALFMVDGIVYPTRRHRLTFFLHRALNHHRWQRYAGKIMRRLFPRPEEAIPMDFFESNYPNPEEATRGYQDLVDRGVPLSLLYTGGFTPYYSYRSQFFDMLPGLKAKGLIELDYWPDVDHLFMLQEDRARYIHRLVIWLLREFPALATLPLIAPQPSAVINATPILPEMSRNEVTAPSSLQEEAALLQTVLVELNRTLAPTTLEPDDSFFDFGGTSVLALRVVADLSAKLSLDIPVVALYSALSARGLARAIQNHEFSGAGIQQQPKPMATAATESIAIIGMACHVPGARNTNEFWRMICELKEGITNFRREELDPSLPDYLRHHSQYVGSRGVIEGDRFDNEFFKISRREAQLLDPQQRILLETCWQALEDSGYIKTRGESRIAVYAGVGANSYITRNLAQGHFEPHSEEEYLALLNNDKDYVATRLAYHLNLKGPAVSVHTACSTSLVAVIEAIKAIQSGQADMAVAGAAAINAPIASGHLYQNGGIFSEDGHCRPFDAKASGTMFSDGAAVVVLKPLSRAQADGDTIYAVLKGWGINNDGSAKSSFAAPSIQGQAEAVAAAIAMAGEGDVGYLECHGTATPIGDPIELEALRRAYVNLPPATCAIGSVKANIGHLTAAAGTIGLIKAALAVYHGVKPGLLHYTQPHPNLRLERLPFYIPNKSVVWNRSHENLRRAGVSSFGIGGTNAHVIVEEAPALTPTPLPRSTETKDPWITVRWSARSPEACQRLWDRLPVASDARNLSYTLAHRRESQDWMQAVTTLGRLETSLLVTPRPNIKKSRLVFCFPGQGSQYPRMGLDLAAQWPRFEEHYSRGLEHFHRVLNLDLRTALRDESLLNQTQYTQAALFVLEWALAQSLIEVGLEPVATLGHSLGEISAAAVAGVVSFTDAAYLVYHRARLMQKSAPGVMLAVRCSKEQLQPWLDACDLAAENGPRNLVVSGPAAAIERLEEKLRSEAIAHRRLNTAHAFHSAQMDPVLGEFRDLLRNVSFQKPRWPLYSTVSGLRLTDDEATSPEYWTQQIRKPVLFYKASQNARLGGEETFVEIGPRDTLHKFLLATPETRALAALPYRDRSEVDAFSQWLSELACLGHDPFVATSGQPVGGIAYPFYGEKHWLAPRRAAAPTHARQSVPKPGIQRPVRAVTHSPEVNVQEQSALHLLAQLLDLPAVQIAVDKTWNDLGMDSLLLTQWSLKLQREFGIDINLKRLQTDVTSLKSLNRIFAGATQASPGTPPVSMDPSLEDLNVSNREVSEWEAGPYDTEALHQLMREQILLMNRQLDLMQQVFGGRPPQLASPALERTDSRPAEVERGRTVEVPAPLAPISFHNDQGLQVIPQPPGSFLGLDADGQPALFLEDPSAPGQFLKVLS